MQTAEGAKDNSADCGPKSIVLFSDGTGNSSAKLFKTNVWRMYEAVDLGPPTPGKRKQIAFYDNGVGTSALRPFAALAGVFGFGLKRNILELYRYACRNYDPADGETEGADAPPGGDEIYGFGFSRGAFTMRLVVALIADQGLVRSNGSEAELLRTSSDAYRAFRSRFLPRRLQWPTRAVRAVRAALSRRWRLWRGTPLYDRSRNYRPTIRFVGVWDTVAAYGGPIIEITRGIDNWIYALSMPNYRLSPRVGRARHALAIDDERDAFHPLLWDEVHEDRLVADGSLGRDRLQQVWFTGMHADVGGGYPDESLSYVSFLWMMNEAEKAGLRSLKVVTDRYRALASSAGPIHDSRSGPGAYYRYQPRNIGGWLHPPDTESIVHDPQLVDEDGKPKGLLTRVQVHESVIARAAAGTDGYAPFTLPAKIEVVPPQAGGETALQADNETPVVPPVEDGVPIPILSAAEWERVEDPDVGQARSAASASVWDLVWRRRINYFATLLLTLLLVLMPWWVAEAWEPPLLADGRTWIGGLIRMLAVVTPEFVDPLIDTMADNSFYFLALVLLIWFHLRRSRKLETRLRDRARVIWARSLKVGGPPPAAEGGGLARSIRVSKAYRRPMRFLKWSLLPALSALLIVLLLLWLLLAVYTQLRLPDLEQGEALCKSSGASHPLEVERFDFSPAEPCRSVGATVQRRQRYIVDIEVTKPWTDGGEATDPAGLAAGELGPAGYVGVPFRRVLTANYLQPILEIRRGPGLLQRGNRVHIEPLEMRQQGDSPTVWRGEFVAARSGELALFPNEAVLPFVKAGTWNVGYFYRDRRYGNGGMACVTIRRADLVGALAPPASGSACKAADSRAAAEAEAAEKRAAEEAQRLRRAREAARPGEAAASLSTPTRQPSTAGSAPHE
ncbi:MAG: DUF2235 domain-containing protein [Allosphingosinicella sp.]